MWKPSENYKDLKFTNTKTADEEIPVSYVQVDQVATNYTISFCNITGIEKAIEGITVVRLNLTMPAFCLN